MQSQIEGIFSLITDSSAEQAILFRILKDIFKKELTGQELITEFKKKVPIDLLIDKKMQECYEIYRIIRTELGKRNVEVFETHLTGPLMSHRITSAPRINDERLDALWKFAELRTELNRERRE